MWGCTDTDSLADIIYIKTLEVSVITLNDLSPGGVGRAASVTLYVVEIGEFGSVCLSLQRPSFLDTRTDSDLANGEDRERTGAGRGRTRGVLLASLAFRADLGLVGVLPLVLLSARVTAEGL